MKELHFSRQVFDFHAGERVLVPGRIFFAAFQSRFALNQLHLFFW